MQALLVKLEEDILLNPPTDLITAVKKQESHGKLYFAKYECDGHWYRVQIIDWSPCETLAQIYFVDYGNTDVIKVNKDIVYPLSKLSDVLNLYPFQAVKVSFRNFIFVESIIYFVELFGTKLSCRKLNFISKYVF